MSFPFHDRIWTDTADFVEKHRAPGESVLAPDLFWWRFERIARYAHTQRHPDARHDWAILHKGELPRLAAEFLRVAQGEMRPVFANEVFVVWARRGDLPRLSENDPHLAAYHAMLLRPMPTAAAPPNAPAEPVLPDPGSIARFDTMSPRDLRQAMDAFYRNGGYRYETLRDKAYYAEIDRCVGRLLPTEPDMRILDIGCGIGRIAALVPPGRCRALVGIDLSPVAVSLARERWAARDDCHFAAMDATRLAFGAGAFDVAAFVDAAEHVIDIEGAIAEAARVLRPGGTLVVTAANRDSLNQVIARKLGFPGFVTNYQHVREFSLGEFEALLAARGFAVAGRMGLMLYPYWGIPGIDEVVRHLTDDDPEVVEMLRDMGTRVDPSHAYCFVLSATKAG